MGILYLTEQQSWVAREGECLVIHLPAEATAGSTNRPNRPGQRPKKEVQLSKIEEVLVFGDITISTPALTSLLLAKVNVVYFTRHGTYLGTLSPGLTKNSLLRLAQHESHANLPTRHRLARYFVLGKLRNMRTVLLRYNRTSPNPQITEATENLRRCLLSVHATEPARTDPDLLTDQEFDPEMEPGEIETGRMNGLGSLLGCEGAGSAAYFRVFAQLIKCDWPHGFTRRMRRPPTDPVNAMLSYGYTVLASQIGGIVSGVGFDPYIGWLHSSRYGKPALALDLLEEFRPIIVDSVVLSLFNNRQLEPDSFRQELNACLMTETTKQLFLRRFEERLQEPITHPFSPDRKATYRRCIELQARLLSKYLLGEVSDYVPFSVR